MTIYKAHIPMNEKPKPRGRLGKSGNMTHAINDYVGFQQMFLSMLRSTSFKIPKCFHALVFQYNIKPKRGGKPDLSNLQGFVEDSLVKGGYIKDDNWTILGRYFTFSKRSEVESSLDLYCVETQNELIHIIKKYDVNP